MTALLDRYYGVALVEARRCNPNGDPDAGNRPRTDMLSGVGLMTPMSIKRKVRNFVEGHYGLPLYHRSGAILRDQRAAATGKRKLASYKSGDKATTEQLRANQMAVCEEYFDARAFGAVMDLGEARAMNACGPVWVGMAETIDPVQVDELGITRQSVEAEVEKKENRTMGTLSVVAYGLYRFEFEVLPSFAARTGFSVEDLAMLKVALVQCFEQDQSSNRKLDLRRMDVFKHASQDGRPCLGHEPRARLRDRVTAVKKDGVANPSRYEDYAVGVDLEGLHQHVTHESWA